MGLVVSYLQERDEAKVKHWIEERIDARLAVPKVEDQEKKWDKTENIVDKTENIVEGSNKPAGKWVHNIWRTSRPVPCSLVLIFKIIFFWMSRCIMYLFVIW